MDKIPGHLQIGIQALVMSVYFAWTAVWPNWE